MHTMVLLYVFGSLMVFFRSATVVVEIASQSLRSSDPTRTSFQLVPASYSYQLPTRTSFQRCQLGLFQNSLLAIVSAVSAVRDRVVTTELEWVFRRYWANFVLIRRSLVQRVFGSAGESLVTPTCSDGVIFVDAGIVCGTRTNFLLLSFFTENVEAYSRTLDRHFVTKINSVVPSVSHLN